jgi:hypothetical protein
MIWRFIGEQALYPKRFKVYLISVLALLGPYDSTQFTQFKLKALTVVFEFSVRRNGIVNESLTLIYSRSATSEYS